MPFFSSSCSRRTAATCVAVHAETRQADRSIPADLIVLALRQGLDHVIFVTALEGKLLLRQYRIALKKSGTRVPRVELQASIG